MLPIPFIKYIPKFFKRDQKLTAYADKMDDIMLGLKSDTLGINDVVDPYKIPANLVDEQGYYLNSGIKSEDTERQKRVKNSSAVQGHKKRGSFKFDVKPKIDNIAGGDSKIIRGVTGDDFIIVGDGNTPDDYYWSVMGIDGIDLDQGISVIGSGDEIEIAGNIYIDVDNDSLTQEQLDKIILELEDDIAPSYYRIFLGYVDGDGNFEVYDTIG